MQKITPFLWFDSQAEEAVNYYASIFPDAKIGDVSRYPEGTPGPAGEVMTVNFELFGQEFTALNGGPMFKFNEAISFVVNCETQEEIDGYWDKLVEGGEAVQCGWLRDKYGLSWQIVPTFLNDHVSDPDPVKSQRMMQAMLQMVKLDLAALKKAYDG